MHQFLKPKSTCTPKGFDETLLSDELEMRMGSEACVGRAFHLNRNYSEYNFHINVKVERFWRINQYNVWPLKYEESSH